MATKTVWICINVELRLQAVIARARNKQIEIIFNGIFLLDTVPECQHAPILTDLIQMMKTLRDPILMRVLLQHHYNQHQTMWVQVAFSFSFKTFFLTIGFICEWWTNNRCSKPCSFPLRCIPWSRQSTSLNKPAHFNDRCSLVIQEPVIVSLIKIVSKSETRTWVPCIKQSRERLTIQTWIHTGIKNYF